MKRAVRPPHRRRRRVPARPQRLDPHTTEAIARFVRLLARCGIAPRDIARAVVSASRQVPKSWAGRVRETIPYLHHTSHILTLWFSDPRFLGSDGTPRALPVAGKEDSIEALAQRVEPRLVVRDVVRFLERGKVLRRVGDRYVPRERMVVLRGTEVADSFRKLRGLLGMLRAFEHNEASKRQVPGWYEAFADNPRFPVRAIPALDRKVRAHANKLLVQLDGDMHREERLRDPAEPTVRIGVGVYRFEEALPAGENPQPRKRATRRKPRRRQG